MASTGQKSRAFIIGDKDDGLTIVITNPVMVAHFSIDELTNGTQNTMTGNDPEVLMAGIVQELVPLFRGVHVDRLRERETQMRDSPHGRFTLEQEEGILGELDYAKTIAQQIVNKGSVVDVDFCLAMDIDPATIVAKGRNTSPASEIRNYLATHGDLAGPAAQPISATPAVFPIAGLNLDDLELGAPSPWQDPGPGTP